jgi:hypothetical protein
MRPNPVYVNPESAGFGGYQPTRATTFFSNFMVNALDVASRYKFSAVLDSPAQFNGGRDAPIVTSEKQQKLESDNPGLKIPDGTPDWLADSMASDHQEMAYYSGFAKLGSKSHNWAAMAGALTGGLTDIPADISGGKAAKLGSKALTWGFSKLMRQSFMDQLVGNPFVQGAVKAAHSSMTGALATGGYDLGTVPTQIMSAEQQGKPLSDLNVFSNLASSMWMGAKFGAVAGMLGIGARFSLKKIAGLTDNEEQAIKDAYTPVTPKSNYDANLDGMAQMVNGLDPSVGHILQQGKYDAGSVLRAHLQKNGISLNELTSKLNDGQFTMKSDFDKLTNLKDMPENIGDSISPIVKDLKDNPSTPFEAVEIKNRLHDSLGDSPVDKETFSNFVPDEVNKSERLTQDNMYDDFRDGKLSKEDLPKEVQKQLQNDEKINRFQFKLDRANRLFEATGDERYKIDADFAKKALKETKSKKVVFLKPEQEIKNIKTLLTDENGKPISGWKKNPAMRRLEQLKVINNEARNFYMQLHLDDPAALKKQFMKARDGALGYNYSGQMLLKSIHDHVANKNDPVSYNQVVNYTTHLQSSPVSNFKWEVPSDQPVDMNKELSDSEIEMAKNKLAGLKNEDLKDQLAKNETAEKQIPFFKKMATDLKDCILGSIE